ncbi:MAG: signal peptide peptidase SppA [Myxococcota bacterium]
MPIPVLATLLLLPGARAQGVERPTLPFRSLAGEDGVHVMYSNPALMNFDRDAGYAAYYDTTGTSGGLNSLTFATTGNGVGAGLGYRQVGASADGWWTVSSAASVRVTDAITIGSSFNWQLPDGGDNNFVSWDIGLGWRPAPFLGIGAVVQNLGSPAPDLGVNTRYGAGLAIRPAGDLFTLGLDWLADAPPDGILAQRVQASVRLKPARGVWLRLFADDALDDFTDVRFGGAVELRFADLGVGLTARGSADDLGGVGGGGYVQSIPSDDQLFRARRRVATFDFEGAYPYQPQGGLLSAAPEGYLTLLRRMKSASDDPQVRGILLEIGSAPFSLAQVEEIRDVMREARANGKPVVAYLNGEASNAAYLLATACDRVYLHPAGQLDLVGLGAETQYFRGALELVGVSAQYAKRGIYKSAPEQWTEAQSTDPARLEMNELLDDLSSTLVDGIALGRGKSPEEIRALIDKGPFTSQEAEKNGLVDGLVYPDELQDTLAGTFPEGFSRDEGYARSPDTSGWDPQRAVAVVVIDGAISSGQTSSGGLLGGAATGSDTVVQALNQARRTNAVKAVVLRVDSPGGSAFASDEIWRAVKRVQEEGKPVIVSMGGYAASGGYYVAAGADAIYALPTTVTGSIGVYGGKINGGGLFEKLDIHTEQFNRGRNAGMYSISRPFDDIEFAALDRMIADTYRQFKDKVQEGRSLTPEKVEALAQGRVWSGLDAKEQGLVDEHGGFFDAVERARTEAGLRPDAPYTLVTYDPWGGGGDLPTQLVSAELPKQIVRAFQPKVELPEELKSFWALSALKDERVFAMMPYHLEIK